MSGVENKKVFVVTNRGNKLNYIEQWADLVKVETEVAGIMERVAGKSVEATMNGSDNEDLQETLNMYINAKKILSNTSDFEDLYYTALFIFPNRCEKYSGLMEDIMNLKQRISSLTREVKIKINTKGDGDGRIYSKISSLVTDAGFTICKSGENHIMSVDVDIAEQITGKAHQGF